MKFIELEYYDWQAYTDGIQITNFEANKVAINVFNIASIEEINKVKKLRCVKNSVESVNYTLIRTVTNRAYLVNKSYNEVMNLLK